MVPVSADESPAALIARAREFRFRADYQAAWAVAEAAVSISREDPEPDPLLFAEGHLLLGQLAEDLGDPAAAEAAYVAAATAADPAETPANQVVAVVARTRLVSVLRDRGAVDDAEVKLSQAMAIAEADLPDGLEHAEVVAEQSRQRLDMGAPDEAERLAAQAVAVSAAAPPSVPQEGTRARTLSALGTVLRVRGRYSDAYPVLQEALTAAQAAFGTRSLEAANALNDLGVCDKFSGRFEEGVHHYQSCLRMYQASVGLEHPDVASVYHNLGGILHASRDFIAAEPWARRAVELRKQLLGPEHIKTAADQAALASILLDLNRDEEANTLLEKALATFEGTYGPDNHHEIAVYLNGLATIARRRGDLDQAERLHRRALAIKERLLGHDHPEVAITLNNLAVVCRRRGNLNEAEALYRAAITILSRTVDSTHPTLTASRNNLDRLLHQRRDTEDPPRSSPEPRSTTHRT